MVADSLDVFASVRDGASVSRINDSDRSARTGGAPSPSGVLSRVGEIHGRVFVKGGSRGVLTFSIIELFRIPSAPSARGGCWRVVHVALHARATTVMMTRWRVVKTVDPIRLHV